MSIAPAKSASIAAGPALHVFHSICPPGPRARSKRPLPFPTIACEWVMLGNANGLFERALGPGVKIEWKTFNAGPAAIEALFAGAIDMTYIGPNPAIQGYV